MCRWLLPLAALLSVAAATLPVQSVIDVDQHLHELNGQRVLVHGWIVECRLPRWWECGIAPAVDDVQHELRISGDSKKIDRRFFHFSGAEVVLDAKVDESCRVSICTDRGAVLLISGLKILKRGVHR